MAQNIRNFSIIAHIDHGKSTLADRLLDVTGTVEKRKMKEQVLDVMELERERGITIKMQPVRMEYVHNGEKYILNLIDTPGHIDFSYEVSRALQAVEGTILLVDSAQGVQAQTLAVLEMAKKQNLVIIPVLNKIDLPNARPDEVGAEVAKLLGVEESSILKVSGKTGGGVKDLLAEIIERFPGPRDSHAEPGVSRALVFDFEYSNHKGVIVYVRILDGEIKNAESLQFIGSGEKFISGEVGIFAPEKKSTGKLSAGEIGYVVTAIKKPGEAKVGDTITGSNKPGQPVAGYETPRPVVWASVYPESQDDFDDLKQALLKLKLSDSSLSFEEESSGALGRGFRCGFLGMLHLEIIIERLKREFNLSLVVATPTISYRLVHKRTGEAFNVYSPHLFPEDTKDYDIFEPWVAVKIISPADYLSGLLSLFYDHEAIVTNTETFQNNRTAVDLEMPLRELMRNFFDEVKSASSGYASLSYNFLDERSADVSRLDILINGEEVPAFSRVIARRQVETESKDAVVKLKELLPKQWITIKIQAKALGRIISSESISAMRKDVTGYLYGGDVSRKKKLLEKQKKGKKKMQQMGKVNIPEEVFLKMMGQNQKRKGRA